MKTKHFIATLILSILLPVAAMAETFIADGVTYTYTVGETGATITSIDNSATTLVIRKSFEVSGATYTVGKLSNGSVFSNSQATTVRWDGKWNEPDLTGAQFYNFKNVKEYQVSNPNETNAEISDGNGQLTAIDGVLFVYHSTQENHLLAYPCKKKTTDGKYTIPSSRTNPYTGLTEDIQVNIVMASAFRNNENLTSIDLDPYVQIIRNEAFAGCKNLTAINAFPNDSYTASSYLIKGDQYVSAKTYFETIYGVLFQNDTRRGGDSDYKISFPTGATFHKTLVAYPAGKSETTYNIPDGTEVLGRSCFFGCTKLTNIGFETNAAEDLIEIREYAFNHCENLETFTIPVKVEYINMKYVDPPINPVGSGVQTGNGYYSYKNGNNDFKVDAATAMGSFDYCYKLRLAIDPSNTHFKVIDTYNGSTLLSNVLLSADESRLVRYGCTTDFPGYMVPRAVTWIDSYAFQDAKVEHVVLPSEMTVVSRNTFENAKKLDFITIPPMVTSISQNAFSGCDALSQVFMMPETPPTLANSSVFGSSDYTMYVKPNKTVNNQNNFNSDITIDIPARYKAKDNYPEDEKIQTEIPVTLNAYGMATMCRDFAVELNSDLIAYFLTNQDGLPNEPSETLTFIPTNCRNTAMEEGRFIPARTGNNHYGDYRGVVLKTAEAYNPSKNYTYQISVEDFNNTFNLRGKNQTNGSNYYPDASYTLPRANLTETTRTASDVDGTNCKVDYFQIGYSTGNSSAVNAQLNGAYYHKVNGDNSYIKIKPNTGSIQSGDTFRATLYTGGTPTTGFYFKARPSEEIPRNSKTVKLNAEAETVLEYTIQASDINDADGSLTVYRFDANCYVNKIEIISSQKANTSPRTIRSSRYILGTPVETNITVKTTNDQNQECTTFGLKGDKFQRTSADGMVKANKAYLCLPADNVPGKVPGVDTPSTAKFTMVFKDFSDENTDSETTGIHYMDANIEKSVSDGNVYNMQGSRVGDATTLRQGSLPKGLYILNGKKYVVK